MKPLGEHILVYLDKDKEETTESGLVMPSQVSETKESYKAEVVSVGDEVQTIQAGMNIVVPNVVLDPAHEDNYYVVKERDVMLYE